MSRLSGGVEKLRSDFELRDEIISVIPTDPFEQLEIARKITSMAIASRVSNLESEVVGLRQKLQDREISILELEEKVSRVERHFRESDSKLKIVFHENMNLKKESDSLAATVKNLTFDIAKLETFKRQLIKSLSNENVPQTKPVDIKTYDQEIALEYNGPKFSVTPYITTPNIISPRSNSAAGSPKRTSGLISPKYPNLWYTSSQQSSAANSPPRGLPLPARSSRVDGKEFFRQARSRLSYEQFKAFLANIKELNAQKQTREETLRRVNEIFGTENKDLYMSFQGLVTKNQS